MSVTGETITATWHCDGWITHPPRVPLRDLFDVEVFNSGEFALIPKNEVARQIAHAWISGQLKTSAEYRSQGPDVSFAYGRCMERVTFKHEPNALITNGGDPHYTGQSISAEERAVALAAIEAHRASKRPAPRKRRNRR